jgi:N-acetylglucosamine kinase-like BadF-type ATPase
VPDVIAWVTGGDGQVMRLASLARLVAQAADAGDPLAADILCQGAQALADITAAAVRQVWPAGPPAPLHVACCGGVWAAGARVADAYATALGAILPASRPTPPLLPSVGGAVLLAMGGVTKPLAPRVLDRIIRAFRGVYAAQ